MPWSASQSEKPPAPEKCIYGTLNGKEVMFITINGLFRGIRFYHEPETKDENPTNSYSTFNLDWDSGVTHIIQISLAHKFDETIAKMEEIKDKDFEETLSSSPFVEYNNTEYVRVAVTFNSGIQKIFLLDAQSYINAYEKELNQEWTPEKRLVGEWKLRIRELESLTIEKFEKTENIGKKECIKK